MKMIDHVVKADSKEEVEAKLEKFLGEGERPRRLISRAEAYAHTYRGSEKVEWRISFKFDLP